MLYFYLNQNNFVDLFQVNVLTHATEVTLEPKHLRSIKALKAKHLAQDQKELFGAMTDTNIVDRSKLCNDPCSITENEEERVCDVGDKKNDSVLVDASSLARGDTEEGDLQSLNEHNGTHPDEPVKENLGEGTCSDAKVSEEIEILEASDGGALWDIFRREDVPLLQKYLNKHFREFRHIHAGLVPQVTTTFCDNLHSIVILILTQQSFLFLTSPVCSG